MGGHSTVPPLPAVRGAALVTMGPTVQAKRGGAGTPEAGRAPAPGSRVGGHLEAGTEDVGWVGGVPGA